MRARSLRIRSLLTSRSAQSGVALLFWALSLALPALYPPQLLAEPLAASPPSQNPQAQASPTIEPGAITEDELRQRWGGKTFYLRGGYLDNVLHFDERGKLNGNSPQMSYTLGLVEIRSVHLRKHKLELEGVRYGLHFLGALPSEDPTQAADKVRLTPKKKLLKITIDREELIAPKKKKSAKAENANGRILNPVLRPQQPTNEDQTQIPAVIERPTDLHGVTTTTSMAHANKILTSALGNVFANGMDDRMIAALPDYWKLYYQAAAAKSDYRPSDASIFRQSAVERKARLLLALEPQSNEFAQANGVAGLALYHVVVLPDGTPGQIAVSRPIGFGLDENAVASIRKASFQPAIKDGKTVSVLLDVLVQFRIYSKRTAITAASTEAANVDPDQSNAQPLPGPYSVK